MIIKLRENIVESKFFRLIVLICLILVVMTGVSIFKYKGKQVNYHNSDACWHTLMTMQAYEETDISEHLFLPIVSFGEVEDKNILWGATVKGENGNYYYTSFSPVGYVLPWLFVKIFDLSISERSIYLFNSMLFITSAILWSVFIFKIFKKSKYVNYITVIGFFTYVFSPEVLHGMGITYWHQSIMQVTLIIQFISYYNMCHSENSKKTRCLFYFMCFINPYIEWTGYVANIGFCLVEIIRGQKNKSLKTAIKRVFIIGGASVCAMLVFIIHYLQRIEFKVFFASLKERFLVRNTSSVISVADVFAGYIESFLYLWLLLLVIIILNFIKNGKIEFNFERGIVVLILVFPVLENVLMKEHAFSYSYDRMKFVFTLSFLICDLCNAWLNSCKRKKINTIFIVLCTIILCGLNLKSYNSDSKYVWDAKYRSNNEKLATYINSKYKDSVMSIEGGAVRGYISMLYKKGIYEGLNVDNMKGIALNFDKRYVVILKVITPDHWTMHEVNSIIVYDTKKKIGKNIYVSKGKILETEIK